MKIAIQGASALSGSFGRVNLHLGRALSGRGHRVVIEPWDQSPEDCRAALVAEGLALGDLFSVPAAPTFDADVVLRQIWPPVFAPAPPGARLVVIQSWEYGSVPLSWLAGIEAADAIWVPSSTVKAGYVQSGIAPDKVWVVPNGTDLLAEGDLFDLPTRGECVSILFVGNGIHRKGCDILIDALDDLDDAALRRVKLTVKETASWGPNGAESLVERALSGRERVATRTSVIRAGLARRDLAQLMCRHHLLAQPYRAEGFALPVLEAMGCGLPVLVPRGGATDDYCGTGEAFFVDTRLERWPAPFVDGLVTVDFPYHREPDGAQFRQVLRALVDGQLDLGATREAARARAATLSWDNVGRLADAALEELVGGRAQEDRLHGAALAVQRVVTEFAAPAIIDAARALLGVGDWKSALQVLDLGRRHHGDDPQLGHSRRRIESVAATQPDLWSAAPWRLDLVAALRDNLEVPAVVHGHEGSHDAVARIAQAISPYFSSCRSVLDLGCGKGAMMRTLRAQGKSVAGIEGDADLVAALAAEGFSVTLGWIPDDLDALGEVMVDGVFMGHIIEHLAPERALEVLSWAAAHLNDGGTLVVQTPDFSRDVVAQSNFWLDPTHVRPYPLGLLTGMLESVGLAPVAGGCRSLAPDAPLDIIAVGRLRRRPAPGRPRAVRVGAPPRLVHFGLFSSESGMGRAGRALFDQERIRALGVETIRVDLEAKAGSDPPPGTLPFSEALEVSSRLAVIDVPVGWLPDVLARVRAAKRVVRLAFEAHPLPGYLGAALAPVDEVWAMSREVERAAVAGGCDPQRVVRIAPSVAVAPHARANFAGAERGGPVIFTSVFNFEPRKNPEALLRAYAALRARGHGVELKVKTSGLSEEQFWQWAARVLDAATLDDVHASLSLHTGRVDDVWLQNFLAHCDAFVLPTRGEGFGLPFLEAMAAGVPVICPDHGGHRDFCDEETSFLVPTTSLPCAAHWDIPLFRESRWREVVGDELVAAMERVVTDPAQVRKKAAASLERARDLAETNQRGVAEARIADLLDLSVLHAT